MDKEKLPKFESGFSEKKADLDMDRALSDDQVKGSTIFDPQKKNKKKSVPTIDSNTQ